MKLNLQFFGGNGSGSHASGGGSASAANKAAKQKVFQEATKAVNNAATNRAVYSAIRQQVKTGNINIDAPKIQAEMDKAPVGTKFSIYAYDQKENAFTKTGAKTWSMAWQTTDGNVYWTIDRPSSSMANEVFNALNQ